MPNPKILLLLSLFGGLFACGEQKETPVPSEPPKIYDFPNILDLTGIPDSAEDRSVYIFSDKGAWFGYGLPGAEAPAVVGSFTGPFLMTQDNGIWSASVLSKIAVFESGKLIDPAFAKKVEQTALPGRLKQVLDFENPKLKVTTELIFADNRTALTRVQIQNFDDEQTLNIGWSGEKMMDDISFSAHNSGSVRLDFKNGNIGIIAVDSTVVATVEADSGKYQIRTVEKTLAAGESWDLALTHSFYFSENEMNAKAAAVSTFLARADTEFSKNENRWNQILAQTLSGINSDFSEEAHRKIAVKCIETLVTNWRSPAGFFKHDGLFPSYNYKWFNGFWSWDSWKHAVAVAKFDTELAKNQIRAMYDFQNEEGMIADCVYRDNVLEEHNWRDTKPPLSGWAIWQVFEKSKDRDFLLEMLPKLEKYHNWWYTYRDHDQNGLCEYGSTDGTLIAAKWESGMDNAVRFDDTKLVQNTPSSWSMNRESVDLNAYLFFEKEAIAKIADAVGQAEKSKQYAAAAEKLKKEIQTVFYDEKTGWFYDIDLNTKNHLVAYAAEGWIPLFTKAATAQQAARARETMIDTSKFATYIPFPTLAADHPKFDPGEGYWRGPIWLDQVYFAITGLKNYGFEEDADRFTNQVFDRLEGLKTDAPIRENYHPNTGKGLEANHFSWSASHLLMLLTDE